ncbi:MAG: nucleoside-diphosphate sugar epimerase [Rhodospirillaceae bacterium]|jgi:UDP-glucuronate decarboxylase|nr:nucleoside-diphosphate sugar epimerase [Rhodospirillaceae bacterium]|tara:strand:- start:1274 stop:2335 length:1062 start_codon:yes stop_codon:yes gene_type:complete
MTDFFLQTDIHEIARALSDKAQAFAGKTVMLSGGRGFLGRYFTEVFVHLNETVLGDPCRLVVLDNLITAGDEGASMGERPNVTFIKHDVIEPLDWNQDVHFVVHAAGIASPFYYRAYPLETLEVATTGTRNMLALAERHQARFAFFSSSEIYGDPDPKYVPTPESYRGNVAAQGPRACYDESKRVGETLCYVFHHKFGLAANTIRPFNVFGPGMQETDYRVMPNFASRIKGGKPLNIYGGGNQTRTFCYITDAINGFLRVLAEGVPGETYNIGNPKPEITMLGLVKTMEKAAGKSLEYNLIEYPDSYPADEPRRRCPDIEKARRDIGFEPRVDLEDGLKRFLGWADKAYTGKT